MLDRRRVMAAALVVFLLTGATGCASQPRVFTTSEYDGKGLRVWDFTNPDKPVVHIWYSAGPGGHSSHEMVELPPQPNK
jgi:hypothetical protein